jgi:hypothetical protein
MFHGRFVKLVPDEQVVEAVEFEMADPATQGEMTITYTLAVADGGTDLTGWRMSLAKLTALCEGEEG